MTLEEAQIAKMRLVADKLDLKPGDEDPRLVISLITDIHTVHTLFGLRLVILRLRRLAPHGEG